MTSNTSAMLSGAELTEAERLLREVHAARHQGAEITEHTRVLSPIGGATVSVRRGPVEVSEWPDSPGVLRVEQSSVTWTPPSVEVTVRQVSDHRGTPLPGAPRSDVLRVLKIERRSGGETVTLADGTRVVRLVDVIAVRPETPVIADRAEDVAALAEKRLTTALGWRVRVSRLGEVEVTEGVSRQAIRFNVAHDETSTRAVFGAVSELRGRSLEDVGAVESAGRLEVHGIGSPVAGGRQHFSTGPDATTVAEVVVRWRERVEVTA